jgi:alpha-beta hydrolase superfamily lysophospholipase
MSEITHPVHITIADGDNVLDNAEIKKFYETVKTPADLKAIEHYDSDHFILSDGWLYEEVAARQIKWLEKVLAK